MKGFADLLVLATEENLAQTVAVGRKQTTHSNRDRQHPGPGESSRETAVIRATVEAPNPCFCSPKNAPIISPHDHLTSGIEGVDSREDRPGIRRLVGDEVDLKGSWLTVDPLVEGAAHTATPVVEDFDLAGVNWEFHRFCSFYCSCFFSIF